MRWDINLLTCQIPNGRLSYVLDVLLLRYAAAGVYVHHYMPSM